MACRELLADLREIRAAAAALDRRIPSPDVWRAIAAKVAPADASRSRMAAVWPQLAAAAALVLMLGAAVWMATGGTHWRGRSESAASDLVRDAASELQLAEQHYTNAITTLEKADRQQRQHARSIHRRGDRAEPGVDRPRDRRQPRRAEVGSNSFVAQTSLLEALRMKVALLQETVSLMSARS